LDASSVYFGNNAGLAREQATSIGNFINNLNGTGNVGIGNLALAANTAINNTAVGASALAANTTGSTNTAVGVSALVANTTGTTNTAVGSSALVANTTGATNTAVGSSALSANTTGASNTAVGLNAGAGNTAGSNNTFIGTNADMGTNANLNNIQLFLFNLSGITNATAIGYNAKVGASNSIVLGGTGTNAVNVGIGNTTPTNTLHITPVAGVNPVRFEGLQASTSSTDKMVVADGTGVLRTMSIPVVSATSVTAANNGLTATNGTVQMGGALTGPTVVTASAANTLAIAGLQASTTSTDNMVVADATTGVLRTVAQPVSNISVKNVSVTIPATAIGHTYATTVTVTGAVVGYNVIVNPRAALPDGVSIAYARVSAADTVEIDFQGPGSSQVTGAGFDIRVMP
jgi:hypothetical protein